MNLSRMLEKRAEEGRPVRVGIIGAGKFGAMYLAQARLTKGTHVLGIDLAPAKAKETLAHIGWEAERYAASSFDDAVANSSTFVTDDAMRLHRSPHLDVLVEATGDPAAGIRHCLAAIANGKHVVMVNVEADVVAGPLLARKAEEAGVVYSLAWGDQPALIAEHVDWARACGFKVVTAGKGTQRYLPEYHRSTPDTVWDYFGWDLEVVKRGRLNPKMFNSFLDGTKSGIEMSAVCNATGLTPQPDGLGFPPASAYALAEVCKPASAGGTVSHEGTTEVVSSLNRDGTPVEHHIQYGTYVVIEGETDYATYCFEEYSMLPDNSFRYAALYRPTHAESGWAWDLGRQCRPAGSRRAARRASAPTWWPRPSASSKPVRFSTGRAGTASGAARPAADASLEEGYLPLGLAHNVKLTRDVPEGERLKWSDVVIDETDHANAIRREMEAAFARPNEAAGSVEPVRLLRRVAERGGRLGGGFRPRRFWCRCRLRSPRARWSGHSPSP